MTLITSTHFSTYSLLNIVFKSNIFNMLVNVRWLIFFWSVVAVLFVNPIQVQSHTNLFNITDSTLLSHHDTIVHIVNISSFNDQFRLIQFETEPLSYYAVATNSNLRSNRSMDIHFIDIHKQPCTNCSQTNGYDIESRHWKRIQLLNIDTISHDDWSLTMFVQYQYYCDMFEYAKDDGSCRNGQYGITRSAIHQYNLNLISNQIQIKLSQPLVL